MARGGRTLAWGSVTQTSKRKLGQTRLAAIQLVEKVFCYCGPWVGFRCDGLGLRLGPRPSGPTQRARMEKRKKIGLVGDPSLASA